MEATIWDWLLVAAGLVLGAVFPIEHKHVHKR